MDVRSFMPVKGDTVWEMMGGPWDKLEMQFDADHAPLRLVLDGHVYEKVAKTIGEIKYDDDGAFLNVEDYLLVTDYQYRGKQEQKRTRGA